MMNFLLTLMIVALCSWIVVLAKNKPTDMGKDVQVFRYPRRYMILVIIVALPLFYTFIQVALLNETGGQRIRGVLCYGLIAVLLGVVLYLQRYTLYISRDHIRIRRMNITFDILASQIGVISLQPSRTAGRLGSLPLRMTNQSIAKLYRMGGEPVAIPRDLDNTAALLYTLQRFAERHQIALHHVGVDEISISDALSAARAKAFSAAYASAHPDLVPENHAPISQPLSAAAPVNPIQQSAVQNSAGQNDSSSLRFDFSEPHAIPTPKITLPVPRPIPERLNVQIDEILRAGRTQPPWSRRGPLWILIGIVVVAGLILTFNAIRTDRAVDQLEREIATTLMQAECAKVCSLYGTTESSLGELKRVSRKHSLSGFDDVFEWHAKPDLTLTLRRSSQLATGAVNTFTWQSSAPARDLVDVSLRLHRVDYALSHVVHNAYGYSGDDPATAQVTVQFTISPSGRVYHAQVLHDATDTMHRSDLDQRYIDIINSIDFGAGHYAPLDHRYTVHAAGDDTTSRDEANQDDRDD